MQLWKTQSSKVIMDYSKFLKIEEHSVELPDGTVIPDWPWVITPNFINIVVVTEDGQFVCFEQVKYAIKDTSLAIVGGYIEPDEDPLEAAKRELMEETGYEADDWTFMYSQVVDANRGCGTAYAYLAKGARKVAEPNADDLEEQHLRLMSKAEVRDALLKGEFKVVTWTACIAMAMLHLD